MLIYKALNKINGKIYIGETNNLEKRIVEHLRSAQRGDKGYFYNALRAYGSQVFEWSTIDIADCREILDEKEEYWINHLHTKPPYGYNVANGGNWNPGKNRGTKRPDLAERNKVIKPMLGKHLSEETKRKLSESKIGKKRPDQSVRIKKINMEDNPAKRPGARKKLGEPRPWLVGEKNPMSKNRRPTL
jgi:group I intron endonuclease